MVIGISPVLIMLLVGSLSFFLIKVFYRGEAVESVRWVLFWFVMAVVLVSRIGIEEGTGRAMIYGIALAWATWVYLVHVHPAYLVGIVLLGVAWYSAHKLTWDCTLIDDDEDASGSGLLQTAAEGQKARPDDAAPISTETKAGSNSKSDRKHRAAVPHPPGLWVVYFSLVALPLFGIGQMLLPAGDAASRQAGLVHLFVYLAAAVGLLLTTSFLGLRRYLRQRYLPMPGIIAFGWLKFGAGIAGVVLFAALLLPRPGVNDAWATLHYQIDYRLREASKYAMRIGPHGRGQGRAGSEPHEPNGSTPASTPQDKNPTAGGRSQSQAHPGESQPEQDHTSPQGHSGPSPVANAANNIYVWFQNLLILAGAILAGWWLFRRRHLLLEMARSVIAAIVQFFRELFQFDWLPKKTAPKAEERKARLRPFAAYRSPFLTGKDKLWSAEQLILYSYEAVQAWAIERGIQAHPEQTAREFCLQVGQTFPDAGPELNRLAFLYGHAAYGSTELADCDLEPVKKLWRYLSGTEAADEVASSPN
jgi:hypothetical protein